MATKTVISKFMLAGALGVVAATASFGPTIRSTDKQPHFAGQLVDEKILSESSTRALGVSKPKGLGLPASRGLQLTFNSDQLHFGFWGEGEEEADSLVENYREVVNADDWSVFSDPPEQLSLPVLAVLTKVVANGYSVADISASGYLTEDCSGGACVESVMQTGMEEMESALEDPSVVGTRVYSSLGGGCYGDCPGGDMMEGANAFRIEMETSSDESWEGGRDDGDYDRIEVDDRRGQWAGANPGSGYGGGSSDPEPANYSPQMLAIGMNWWETQIGAASGRSEVTRGGWRYIRYSKAERSSEILRVTSDIIYALSVYNAGSILYCGVEEAPVLVYEISVSGESDDLDTFQDEVDHLLDRQWSHGIFTRLYPEEFYAMLIDHDIRIEASRLSYRDGLSTKPVTLRGDAAQDFLASCTDSLIDP